MIFLQGVQNRNSVSYTPGRINNSQTFADMFTQRVSNRMRRFGKESQTKTLELTSDFQNAQFEDSLSSRSEARFKEAEAQSLEAVAAISASKAGGSAKSLSEYVTKTQRKRASLKKAQEALEKSKEFYDPIGAKVSFQETGFEQIKINQGQFARDFDDMIATRRDNYSKQLGVNFDDLQDNYGMSQSFIGSNWENMTEEEREMWNSSYTDDFAGTQGANWRSRFQQDFSEAGRDTRVGQADIMDMVMADLIGMDYGNLTQLNTYDGAGTNQGYTADQLENIRNFYITANVSALEQANQKASMEDDFRRKSAIEMQRGTIASQVKGKQAAEEKLSASSEDIQMQLRELDENFMKNIGAFADVPKKRKVPRISFAEDRPV